VRISADNIASGEVVRYKILV